MVALSKPAIQQYTNPKNVTTFSSDDVPLIDLSRPDPKAQLVKACEDFGFFKVINHGVSSHIINDLQSEALRFFSLPQPDKEKAGPPSPFGYGDKRIGPNGDVGWVEYLLLNAGDQSAHHRFGSVFGEAADNFR
ncbi:Gibberellin 2-beta-dioxygenase 2 [Striga hermonthica]|uniref:Gibberellin 2-beta-dioxygenase 2 n=1 Tax=Striga hermonthica TaxID=68872 RepID=A0A9N7R889_STRHE|nr:Gibberellin 2-beta-dioxygenase 2 [Striga hermonthica]